MLHERALRHYEGEKCPRCPASGHLHAHVQVSAETVAGNEPLLLIPMTLNRSEAFLVPGAITAIATSPHLVGACGATSPVVVTEKPENHHASKSSLVVSAGGALDPAVLPCTPSWALPLGGAPASWSPIHCAARRAWLQDDKTGTDEQRADADSEELGNGPLLTLAVFGPNGKKGLPQAHPVLGAGVPKPHDPSAAHSTCQFLRLVPHKATNSAAGNTPCPASNVTTVNFLATHISIHITPDREAPVIVVPMVSARSAPKSITVPREVAIHTGAPPTVPNPGPTTAADRGIVGMVYLHTTVGRQVAGRTVRPMPPLPTTVTDMENILAGSMQLHGTGGRGVPRRSLLRSPDWRR